MLKDYFLLAFKNIRHRRLRSWLTILGIFIGIAAIVAFISLGQGLENYVNEQFEQLGSDKIIIQPRGMGPPGSATSDSLILTNKDLEVVEKIRGVEWASGYLVKQGQAKFKRETGIGFTTGVTAGDFERLIEIGSFNLLEGRIFKESDKYKVIVGYAHSYGDIWKRDVEIGDRISIEDAEFKVIGVMEKIGNPVDDGIFYMPKEVLREILNVGDEESQIMAKTEDGANPEDVADSITRKLRKTRGEKEGQETFSVQTSNQLLETFGDILMVIQAVFIGIASISLFVGGIGIMNTMYTSVLERTREIGIMKAVGAKNSDIMWIFLFESGLLGLVGGVMGLMLGMIISKGIEYAVVNFYGVNFLKITFDPMIMTGVLLFGFAVGGLSGLLPALQASKLKPVDALRYG